MSKNRAKSPRRLPRRSYMLLFSWRFAEVSPAGNRAAPAGETHFPDLSSCGARTELADTPALRCGQSAARKLEGPPVLEFPRSGGYVPPAGAQWPPARMDPKRRLSGIDLCEAAAAGGEPAYSCKRYMGSISTERRSRNISPRSLADAPSLQESAVGIIYYTDVCWILYLV